MPNGKTAWRTLTQMLAEAAREAPALIERAKAQGNLTRHGGSGDPVFMGELMQIRAILAEPQAVAAMLAAARR